MATSQFISYMKKNIPTTGAQIVVTSGGTQTSIIGLSCTNTSAANTITADVYVTRSGVNYYIVKGATVPVGGALVVVGGDQKLVLNAADALYANCSIDTSMDVIASALVIS